MAPSFLDFFSQDLSLDLGSSRTRVFEHRTGEMLDIPSVVAIRTFQNGRREVIALGEEAEAMLGRTPEHIAAIRPVQSGQITEYEVADALLLHCTQTLKGRSEWRRVRVAAAVAPNAPEASFRAIRDACEAFGAREVHLISKPLAAGLGAGLSLTSPEGHLIVDVGSSTTHIAVLCLNEVISSTTLAVGGDVMNGAIIRLLKRSHALLIGAATAERIKRNLGSAYPPEEPERMFIGGRCLREGVPRAVELTALEVCEALVESISAIGEGIRRVLEQTPPEIASDVVDHGVILVGGGSQLRQLDLALRAETGLAVFPVDEPELAIIRGTAQALASPELLERVKL